MRYTLLAFALLSSAAMAVETPVDGFIKSSVNLCNARLEASQNTFNLYDRGYFVAIESRIAEHDEYGKLMSNARNAAGKSYSARQQYLLEQFSDCIRDRTKVAVNILRK